MGLGLGRKDSKTRLWRVIIQISLPKFGAILLHDSSYVYIFQCRLLHGGKIIVKRGVLLPRFMTNSRMMEIILNRELKSSREATKIGRGFVLRRQTKNIYPSISKMSQKSTIFFKNYISFFTISFHVL